MVILLCWINAPGEQAVVFNNPLKQLPFTKTHWPWSCRRLLRSTVIECMLCILTRKCLDRLIICNDIDLWIYIMTCPIVFYKVGWSAKIKVLSSQSYIFVLGIILGWKGNCTQHVNNYAVLKLKVKNIIKNVILFKKLIVWKSTNTKWAKPKYKILKLFCWLDFLGCSFLCIFCKRSICINLFVFGWYVGKPAIV